MTWRGSTGTRRWTWRPGSDLFFTYTNNWIEDTFDRRFSGSIALKDLR